MKATYLINLFLILLLILSTCSNEPINPLGGDIKNITDNTENQKTDTDGTVANQPAGNGAVEGTIQKMNCFFEYLPVVGVLAKIKGTELSDTTSSNGFYRIEQIPEGTNILIASNNYSFFPMPGNIERKIIIKNEETTSCNINLPYVEGIFPPTSGSMLIRISPITNPPLQGCNIILTN